MRTGNTKYNSWCFVRSYSNVVCTLMHDLKSTCSKIIIMNAIADQLTDYCYLLAIDGAPSTTKPLAVGDNKVLEPVLHIYV